MKSDYKKMMLTLIKSVAINLALTTAVIILVALALSQFFSVQFQVSSAALALAIIGTTLAFAGNSFVSDALGRYGAHSLPQYIWGNRMQTIGFALTIVAILVR